MANMTHCRFENTLIDLRDCNDNIEYREDLSDHEQKYREDLIELCCDIAVDHCNEVKREIEEV